MKKAEIKSWNCADHDPIETWDPVDRSEVDFWLNLSIGIGGEDGADNFQVRIVCENMIRHIRNKKYIVSIPYYETWEQLHQLLSSIVGEVEGHCWSGISKDLSELFLWEYEKFKR